MNPNNVTNSNFANVSANNLNETVFSDNIKTCDPKASDVNLNSNEFPDININMRNMRLDDAEQKFTIKIESGDNWNKETRTSHGPGFSETKVTYTYNYGNLPGATNTNNAHIFFGNVFDFLNDGNIPHFFNILNVADNQQELELAFNALSIDRKEFETLTKEQQEKKLKSAYHKAARQYHPDKNVNDKEATEKFQQLEEHKKILFDYYIK